MRYLYTSLEVIKIPKDENKSRVVNPKEEKYLGCTHFVTDPKEKKHLKNHIIPKLKKSV